MAHFAQLDENNVVTQVIVVHNNELMDGTDENEAKGIVFCQSLFGADTRWVQTSYNANFRKNYAGIGYTYDATLDAFVPPQPNPQCILNVETAQWNCPPPDGKTYVWDEQTQSWIEVEG
jgi:hypothetical protein